MDDGVAGFPVLAGDRLKAVHTHDDVLERVLLGADFGVFYVGIYDDDIVCADGYGLVVCFQKTGTVSDKKYLGAGMGVQDGVPFAAVAGDADIEKSGDGAVDGVDGERVEDITAGTHDRRKPPLKIKLYYVYKYCSFQNGITIIIKNRQKTGWDDKMKVLSIVSIIILFYRENKAYLGQ